ncbi:glycoside hydrolase family 89 protein [Coniophora puteana RWD-64-598 SS2]|uniref:Glycoside hydrolase family 89 protein n=1 Tax=Coniophora puteana (strain RWD-64-598) TaxID=741705 RepID=R7SEM3_CONPW|nr:glycoside hydrolase family 89 protein [Coniophora puteana RWD-64-598 SS2]EIW74305.1 glycoside hydrolase family 89 protein [Coniophora puteana RWD-64-598 SS2]
MLVSRWFQLTALAASALVSSASNSSDPLAGIRDLVKRRISNHVNDFTFTLSTANDTGSDLDTFTISDASDSSGGIDIECSTASACARGLYTYATEVGNVDIWWTGSRLDALPSPLPRVGEPITRSAIVEYRYFLNTVTFGYTANWWTFEQWELLLDWAALRGVNLPLAWVGYEHTLAETFRDAGLTDEDMVPFFGGAAFLPWNRFGNIQGDWSPSTNGSQGGKLPQEWMDAQLALQKQIVPRIVELGMTPVLPAFPGFVPPAMHTLFPNASIVNGSEYPGIPAQYSNDSFLAPFDPLYAQLQSSFLAKQTEALGNVTHVWTIDQYNENSPYSGDLTYLANIANSTFASLRAHDPDAIWLMQGWLFFADEPFWTSDRVDAYLDQIPNDGMIILDLFSDVYPQWQRLDSYRGKSWVWCEVHDFGGNMGLEGNFSVVTNGPVDALNSPNSSMKGVGLAMEGLEGNEIIYDVLLDQAWSAAPLDRDAYAKAWATRRFHLPTANSSTTTATNTSIPASAIEAWQTLASTVYSSTNPNVWGATKSLIELAPSLGGMYSAPSSTIIFYDTNTSLVPALRGLVAAGTSAPALWALDEFRTDSIDVARQLLANRFADAYTATTGAYNASGPGSAALNATAARMMQIIDDLDRLLMTHEPYLLSSRIASARAWAGDGGDEAYADYLEYEARSQVTLWGPVPSVLNDYASKVWGGLVGTYYRQRWTAFVEYMNVTPSDKFEREELDGITDKIAEEWVLERWEGPWGPVGDLREEVERVLQVYG